MWSSLRISARYVDNITFDSVALGCFALARKHESEGDALPPGGGEMPVPPATLRSWLPLLKHCAVLYNAPPTSALLAEGLGIGASNVVSYEPMSVTLCPAHYIALNPSDSTVDIVIRGTTVIHDVVADVVGHCEPFFGGHAHAGMLHAAQFILSRELTRLQAICQARPGWTVHAYGHSLGGGIAALIACTLKSSAGVLESLGSPPVIATTFGAPPVMSEDLARGCSGYITSVVHAHDMVAKMSCHHLRQLANEMEACKEEKPTPH
ncbi:hypothetical protein FOA52_012447 [Chlamydomonas sp. UWO 241]|nr:hypothetical protein FOA52_012447 [Chlamydomonas sp. UWO 241]